MGLYKEVFIEQYLVPDYWDGHTIGQGENSDITLGYTQNIGETSRRLRSFVVPRLVGDPFSLQAFRTDDIFDPAEHEVGTIIMQKGESIEANHGVTVDIDSLEGIPPPPLIPLVHSSYKSANGRTTLVTSEGKDLNYKADTIWGIVVNTHDNEHGLACVEDSMVRNLLGGIICKVSVSMAQKSPVKMGEVKHRHPQGKIIKEKIWRIQSADLVAYGNTKPQRGRPSAITDRIWRTAFGSA